MSTAPVITVSRLWKRYGLPVPGWVRRRLSSDTGYALKDVSLEVRPGETLGVIGRNGAGKSTLLKVLAGVTPPTHGRVQVKGQLFPMIELNAGIHGELTGRENVYFLGAIMGLSRPDVTSRMHEIEGFCELGEWFDRPVRKYSSGMKARLGFAVAVNVDAEILLIDEVLAVGDLSFQRKCYNSFEEIRHTGAATVFVSHNMRQVERLCDEVIYLEQGEAIARGPASEVCQMYYEMGNQEQRERLGDELDLPKGATWESSGELDILEVEVVDAAGERVVEVETLEPITVRVKFRAHEDVFKPIISVHIYTSDLIRICSVGTGHDYAAAATLRGDGTLEAVLPSLPLNSGTYSLGLTIKTQDNCRVFQGDNLAFFCVPFKPANKQQFGIATVPVEWRLPGGTIREDPERSDAETPSPPHQQRESSAGSRT